MIGAISNDYRQGAAGYASFARMQQQAPQGGGLAPTQVVPNANSKDKDKGKGIQDATKDNYECRTCAERTYMDGSDDPGVSMKTPTKVNPLGAAAAVMAHEREHVTRNAFKAQAEGRKVVSSSVTLHMGVCSECGKNYVAGGTTRTVTAGKDGGKSQQPEPGSKLNIRI